MTTTNEDIVTIGWGYGVSETGIVVSTLEAAGLHVFAHSGRTMSTAWHWTHALGGSMLRVPASQADLAREILAGITPSSLRRTTIVQAVFALLVYLCAGVPLPPSGFIPMRAVSHRPTGTDRPG